MKITTIGGGNGQSNLLQALSNTYKENLHISSIVSMSDDGRTTGRLMKAFQDELGIHLPPPGDLRRCLFSLSDSEYKDYFKLLFEHSFTTKGKIKDFTIEELFTQVNKEILETNKAGKYLKELQKFVEIQSGDLYNYIQKIGKEILDFKLPLETKIKEHKFGNLLMASLFYNFDKNYDTMLDFMHKLLEVEGKIIPITTKKAFIKAILGNGEVIETQDRISNVADYNSGIADLELMDSSLDARHHDQVSDIILDSDFIIIGPGDLFTSIISNFIIGGIQECMKRTKAKIIYIGNSTNKGGETNGLTQLDFINKIERFLGRKIDIFITNNNRPQLSIEEKEEFQNDISVKGGDYLFISNGEKSELSRRKIKLIEADLLGERSFYKHSRKKLVKVLDKIFF